MLRLLRPVQWSKNALVALPLLMAHRVSDESGWMSVLLAFVALSFTASAAYVLNDLMDRESDRRHPHKRMRPIASGSVTHPQAVALLAVCLALGFGIGAAISGEFIFWLVVYACTTVVYSWRLKRMVMVDVLTLAFLYTLRLLAGGAAANVEISPWLLAFSMFLFLSLAFVKRYAELRGVELAGQTDAHGRAYLVADVDLIRTLGPTSGYLAVLVFALYLNSADAQKLYPHFGALWGICPLLLYWITRLWFYAQRDLMHHDPVVFALTDRVSYIIGGLVVLLAVFASLKDWSRLTPWVN